MKKLHLLIVLVLITNIVGFSQNNYKEYHNERFNFCLLYPSSFEAGIPPTNGDGLAFFDKFRNANILVYGSLKLPEQERIIQKNFEILKEQLKPTYAFMREDESFYVVSGVEDNMIFYMKVYYTDDEVLTLEIQYPIQRKKEFDKIVEKISFSFPHCK